MEQSILESTKAILGVDGQTDFDLDIITHINATFLELDLLGVGAFGINLYIENSDTEWDSLFEPGPVQLAIKTFVYLNVRMLFDPPQTAAAISAMERRIEKAVWLINVHAEGDYDYE